VHSARSHYVIDLILPSAGRTALEVVQIQPLDHARRCGCGNWTHARPSNQGAKDDWTVALSERHLAGPLLVALTCARSLRMCLSRRRIREFLADWFGLALDFATINQCLHEAGSAVAPVVEEQLLAEARASDLLHLRRNQQRASASPVRLARLYPLLGVLPQGAMGSCNASRQKPASAAPRGR